MKRKIFFEATFSLFYFLFIGQAFAMAPRVLTESNQLLLVIVPHTKAVKGFMQRYTRTEMERAWKKVGDPVPVVVGHNGSALGYELKNSGIPGRIKVEGDGRSPMGIYKIGPAFGFAQKPRFVKMKYLTLDNKLVCVYGSDSTYYNQIISTSKIPRVDAQSSEHMRSIPDYRLGSVIQYNSPHPIKEAGSCIFLHIWSGPNEGTEGCIAASMENIENLISWMDASKHPTIGIFTQSLYKQLQSAWALPIPEAFHF